MPSDYIQLVVHCAGPNCGRTKGPINRWWVCHITDHFLIKPWNDNAVREEDNILPLCSEQCAIKMLSVYLSDQKPKAQGGQQQ